MNKAKPNEPINANIPKYLYRYTFFPSLLDLLWRRKLVLVSPGKWHYLKWCDKNDVGSMDAYEQYSGNKIYVLCCTTGAETNFYWDSIGGGVDCRIEFKGQELLQCLSKHNGIRSGKVKYLKLSELEKQHQQNSIDIPNIPFIKRWPYRYEKELNKRE